MSSPYIPEKKSDTNTVTQAINPASVTTKDVGPFCTLATGISQPIASSIQSTINTLNTIQGAVDTIVYAPAAGIQNLQQRILSGEILNNVTLKIAFSIQNIVTNLAKNVATYAVTNALGELASDVRSQTEGVIGQVNTGLTNVVNQVNNVTGNINRLVEAGNAQLVAGVVKLSNFTDGAIQGTIGNTGTVVNDITKIVGGAVGDIVKSTASAVTDTLTTTVKGVTIPQIQNPTPQPTKLK